MRRLALILVLPVLAACASDGAALKRIDERLARIEERLGEMEARGAAAGPAATPIPTIWYPSLWTPSVSVPTIRVPTVFSPRWRRIDSEGGCVLPNPEQQWPMVPMLQPIPPTAPEPAPR